MVKLCLWVSTLVTFTGCMTTRPPKLDRMGPRGNSFVSQNSDDTLDSLIDKYSGSEYSENERPRQTYTASLSLASPLQMGMDKKNVQIQLGSPSEVEVAGQPEYGNERWTYEDTFSTINGYVTATKLVYFENHRVVGWEIN